MQQRILKTALQTTLLIIFLTVCWGASSQPILNFDSLKNVIRNAKRERVRLEAITRLAPALPRKDYDSVFSYAEQAQAMLVPHEDTAFKKASVWYLKGLAYHRQGDAIMGGNYFKKSAEICESLDQRLYLSSLNFLAICYMRQRKEDSAAFIYQKLLEAKDLPLRMRVVSHGNAGIAYSRLGDYDRAISHFQTTLELDSADSFGKLNSILQIANIFIEMEMYDKAIGTLKQGLSASIESGPVVLALYNNLSEAFLDHGEVDSSALYAAIGLKKGQEIKAWHQLQNTYRLLAETSLQKDQLAQTDSILQYARSFCPKFCSPADVILLDELSGRLKAKTGQVDSAIYYMQQALATANEEKVIQVIKEGYKHLSGFYHLKNDQENALLMMQKHTALQDSLQNLSHTRFLADARIKYLTAQKEKALADTRLAKGFYKNMSFRTGAALLLIGSLFMLLYVRYRRKKKEIILKEDELEELGKELAGLRQNVDDVQLTKIIHLKSKASIQLKDILFVKSDKHYLEFYKKDQKHPEVERSTMKEAEEMLPSPHFVRVHKSYIVNINYIRIINSRELMLENGQWINLSRTYKAGLKEIMHKNSTPL